MYFFPKPFSIDLSRIGTYTYTIISLPICFLILWRKLYLFLVLDYGQIRRIGNMVKCCMTAPWEGHLLKPFPVRHGCWVYMNHLHVPTLPQKRPVLLSVESHYHIELPLGCEAHERRTCVLLRSCFPSTWLSVGPRNLNGQMSYC